MADASKLKGLRRPGLGAPPPLDEARTDLAPEPSATIPSSVGMPVTPVSQRASHAVASPVAAPQASRMDGRTMRRSGRTVQFATRVSPEFDERIRHIALQEGRLLVEVLERALDAYEASRKIVSR